MIDRRSAILFGAGAALGFAAPPALRTAHADTVKLTDDGLHYQPWFEQTFLDLKEDAAEAHSQGKSLLIFFEQRGCPYCGEMHKVNLGKPEIVDYIKKHFYPLQLNMYGSRTVKDFDGTELEERKLAQRWKVNFTPTLIFFPSDPAQIGDQPGNEAKAWELLGYWKPFHFMGTLVYVNEKGYDTEPNFQHWLSEYREKLRAEGKDVSLW